MRGIIQSTFTDELRANNNQIIQKQYQSVAPSIYMQDGYDNTDNRIMNVVDLDDDNQVARVGHQ